MTKRRNLSSAYTNGLLQEAEVKIDGPNNEKWEGVMRPEDRSELEVEEKTQHSNDDIDVEKVH